MQNPLISTEFCVEYGTLILAGFEPMISNQKPNALPLSQRSHTENPTPRQEIVSEQHLEPTWWQIACLRILTEDALRLATSVGLEATTALAGVHLGTNTGLCHWLVYNCQSK